MIWSLAGALGASVCFGVATVLQAMAARATPATSGVDPRLLLRLARSLPFVAGLLLDLLGFLLELAALRSLPLFVVQAAVAANLAVTAVAASQIMRIRLSVREWSAVAGVCAGLAMLGLSAGHEHAAHAGTAFRTGLLVCAIVLAAAGFAAGLLRGTLRSAALGTAAGLGFAIVAIAARVLTGFDPRDLVGDPAAYALVIGGVLATLFYATALQRGSITTTTAAVVVAETVVPAALGVLLLGDETRPGFGLLAAAGFGLAVACTLALARFGEPPQRDAPGREPQAPAKATGRG